MNCQIIRILLTIPLRLFAFCRQAQFFCLCEPPPPSGAFHKNFLPSAVAKIVDLALLRRKGGSHHPAPAGAKGGEKMKDSYEQRIQNQFGAFCVKVFEE